MEHYFRRIAPGMDWGEAKSKRWRSVDILGKEGSREKEKAIRNRVLSAPYG